MKISKKDYVIAFVIMFIYYSLWVMDGNIKIYIGIAFAALFASLFIGSISNLLRYILKKYNLERQPK